MYCSDAASNQQLHAILRLACSSIQKLTVSGFTNAKMQFEHYAKHQGCSEKSLWVRASAKLININVANSKIIIYSQTYIPKHDALIGIYIIFIYLYFWKIIYLKTPNSVSQKIRILLKTNTKKGFLEILANWKVWTWKVWACTALNT